ncbi:MAG: transcriptional regulator, GntR family [Rhodoglobus sp.]|nr:transcriptional regulator, GntR family [Rhodoglobus sp.]
MGTPPSDRQPLADRMYDVLLDQFMDGTRGAGEPLNIGELSRELHVSQTPLREALARLEHTGLVRREALKGYRVAPLFSTEELGELMDARLVLEPVLAAGASLRTTPEFMAELLATIDDLQSSARLADTEAESFKLYWSSDDQFHRLIAQQSGNSFLADAYGSMGGQVQRFRLFMKAGSTDASSAAEEHRKIYNALRAGDPEAAATCMRNHIARARARALPGTRFTSADRHESH